MKSEAGAFSPFTNPLWILSLCPLCLCGSHLFAAEVESRVLTHYLPQDFLDSYYPAFCRFGRMLQSDKYLMRFRLAAGECIVFDNHRIVHGRAAYSATSGERHLRGCYADRGEMRSTYRALTTEGRFK